MLTCITTYAHNHEIDADILGDPSKVELEWKDDFVYSIIEETDALISVTENTNFEEVTLSIGDITILDNFEPAAYDVDIIEPDETAPDFINDDVFSIAAIDLAYESLTNDPDFAYPFTAGGTGYFITTLTNYGNSNATNTYMGVYLDNEFLGNVGLGTLNAYTRYAIPFELNNVPGDTHMGILKFMFSLTQPI